MEAESECHTSLRCNSLQFLLLAEVCSVLSEKSSEELKGREEGGAGKNHLAQWICSCFRSVPFQTCGPPAAAGAPSRRSC